MAARGTRPAGAAEPNGQPPREAPPSDAAIVATLGLRGPAYLQALAQASDAGRVALWLEIGDALGALGRWDRARLAWERGRVAAESSPATRTLAASFYWRFGQVAEGGRELAEASVWYERAADAFHREGALADEATARMAMARVAFHHGGAGEAWQPARDAVLVARDAGEGSSLLGEALELAGEIALDLGQLDEAIATLRDAVRQHERARRGDEPAPQGQLSSGEVRATVALAEALLERGQVRQAVTTFESVEGFVESHESAETRGRGLGLLALINLELGKAEDAVEPLRKAHEWLEIAGATLRRARLYVGTAQRIEQQRGAEDARESYERAWVLASKAEDRLRRAPIGYALARCYLQIGDLVRADDVIEQVLRHVQDIGDLEGLGRCTELGVRIAVRLAQGQLALDRLVLLARTRGQLGDRVGEVRTLRSALEATLVVPDAETAPVASEFMESLRQTGTEVLGPSEAMEIADRLGKGHPRYAGEIAQMEAERHLSQGRRAEAARTLVRAASWSLQAGERWEAVDLWDRALALGYEVGLPEVEQWAVDRTLAAEG